MTLRGNNAALYAGSRANQNASGTFYKVDKTSGSNKIEVLINTNNYAYTTTDCKSGTDLISGNSYTAGSCYMEAFTVKYLKL